MNEFNDNYETENESNDLSQYDDQYSEAEVQNREFEEINDGKFQTKVDRVEITRAKTTGNPMLMWVLMILGPQYKGRRLWRYNHFETPLNMSWLKTDLAICGIELEKLSDLEDRLSELIGVTLEVTKKTSGKNVAIYFNRRIEIEEGSSDGAGAAMQVPF